MFRMLFLILIVCLAASCETEIPFNGKQTQPVLSINCMASTDSTLEMNITSSRFFLDNDGEFTEVENATVALYVNGTFKENPVHVDKGTYRSQYVAKEGDFIRIEVSAPGFASIRSETEFPSLISDLQIDTSIAKTESKPYTQYSYDNQGFYRLDTVGTSYTKIYGYDLTFSNPKSEQNYYRLIASYQTTNYGYTQKVYLNNFDDIVFGTKNNNLEGIFTESVNDRYSIFSDELIDGKSHTIKIAYNQEIFDLKGGSGYPNGKIVRIAEDTLPTATNQMVINLQSISRSYYLYLKSLKALDMSDPFMSEQVQVFTNVQNGLGIFSARTNQIRTYDLPK